jgi:hypothetical protein
MRNYKENTQNAFQRVEYYTYISLIGICILSCIHKEGSREDNIHYL